MERAQPREDRRRGPSDELLVDDRLGERAEQVGRALQLQAERTDGVDQPGERRVGGAQVRERRRGIEAIRSAAAHPLLRAS
jgi:hypothetical protein